MTTAITTEQLKKHNLICKYGKQRGIFAGDKESAEAFCARQMELTGNFYDWYFSMGRVVAMTLPAKHEVEDKKWYWVYFFRGEQDTVTPALYRAKDQTFHTLICYQGDENDSVEHRTSFQADDVFVLKAIT
jgi:hypothetical protein